MNGAHGVISVNVINAFWICEWILSLSFLAILFWKDQLGKLPALSVLIALRTLSLSILIPLLNSRLSPHLRYAAYFYIYWAFYALEAIVVFFVIHEMFKNAMEPLMGLQRLGMIVFRWVAGISIIVALAVSVGPHVTGPTFLVNAGSELERCGSILQLCLLLFLYLSAKPVGLSYRSRIFGVCLGFGVLAAADLAHSAWFVSNTDMRSAVNFFYVAAASIAAFIWIGYYLLPEPARQPIAVPVTSPFLRWNEIARALGHSGGRVLISDPGNTLRNSVTSAELHRVLDRSSASAAG